MEFLNLEISKVAETLLNQCKIFNCSIDRAWKEYMHPIITEQFTLDKIKEYIKNTKNKEM